MSDPVKLSPVGYIDATVVDLIRTELVNDGDGITGILDQLTFPIPGQGLSTSDQFLHAVAQSVMAIGAASAAAAVVGTVGVAIGGALVGVLVAPAAIAGAAVSFGFGADKVSVTLVVVNATGNSLEWVDTWTNWGVAESEPVVIGGKDISSMAPLPAPNAGSTDNKIWIDSAQSQGMQKGSAAVGVWRFNQGRTLGLSFVGTDGSIQLRDHTAGYNIFLGGQSGYRSFLTSDDQNVAAGIFKSSGGPKTSQDFYNQYLDGKNYGDTAKDSSIKVTTSVKMKAAGNGASPTDLVVTALIEN